MAKPKKAALRVDNLCRAMEEIAPTHTAAEWDNVGLLAGSRDWPLRRVLLTIDLTAAVLQEATREKADAILAYHPPIFRPTLRMIADERTQEGLAATALANRIAIYSPHTALDAAPGGTNDTLADIAGLTDIAPVGIANPKRAGQFKLVVFVPEKDTERLADALFAAGAGRIGDYEQCSYRIAGQGTFFGDESTNPTVGHKGHLERVDEIRLETIVPRSALSAVIEAIHRAHSYEEPAYDIYPLEPIPDRQRGPFRIGRLAKPTQLGAFAASLAKRINAANCQIVGDPKQRLTTALVCVGSTGSAPFDLKGAPKFDAVITGEIRHHDALRYAREGIAVIALGHWASERPVLAPLMARLREMLRGAAFKISKQDRDPFAQP